MARKKVSNRRLIARQEKKSDFVFKNSNEENPATEELASNWGNLVYSSHPTYIHNRTDNFLFVAKQASQTARDVLSGVLSAWEVEANNLKKIAEQNEKKLFVKGIANKQQFVEKAKDLMTTSTTLSIIQNSLQIIANSIPRGDKTMDQIRAVENRLSELYKFIDTCNVKNDFSNLDTTLKKRLAAYKTFLNKYESIYAGDEVPKVDINDKGLLEGVSIRSLNNNVLPKIYEATVAAALRELYGEAMVTALDTKKGTAADIKILTGKQSFYVSVKSQTVQQEKSRVFDTFFNWQAGLNKQIKKYGDIENVQINQVNKYLTDVNFLDLARYMIKNYAYSGLADSSLLENTMQVLAVSSLSEKLFGYNKIGQGEITLATILKETPAATITSNGDVIFMTDLLDTLIKNIRTQLRSYYSYSILHTGNTGSITSRGAEITKRSRNNPLYAAKHKYTTDNKGNVDYEGLRINEFVAKKLAAANATLDKSIKIQIQYKLSLLPPSKG